MSCVFPEKSGYYCMIQLCCEFLSPLKRQQLDYSRLVRRERLDFCVIRQQTQSVACYLLIRKISSFVIVEKRYFDEETLTKPCCLACPSEGEIYYLQLQAS